MKTKNVLVSVLILFVTSFGEGTFAFTFECVDDPVSYCEYQGLFRDMNDAEEEFMMLTERPIHSNFQDMFSALMYIVGCADRNEKHMEMLINPECNIHIYTQKLVKFYEANAEKLNDEEVTKLFEILKEKEGREFFSEGIDSMKNNN